jgi:hypothetical protein
MTDRRLYFLHFHYGTASSERHPHRKRLNGLLIAGWTHCLRRRLGTTATSDGSVSSDNAFKHTLIPQCLRKTSTIERDSVIGNSSPSRRSPLPMTYHQPDYFVRRMIDEQRDHGTIAIHCVVPATSHANGRLYHVLILPVITNNQPEVTVPVLVHACL